VLEGSRRRRGRIRGAGGLGEGLRRWGTGRCRLRDVCWLALARGACVRLVEGVSFVRLVCVHTHSLTYALTTGK